MGAWKMIFKIEHKTTGEIRSGQWDSEYLIFLSGGGNVAWNEYHHWKPHENRVAVPQMKPKSEILSIHNTILFIDIQVSKKNGEKVMATIPLKIDRHTSQYIEFEPLVGRLLFWRCSFLGKIRGRKEKVYQKSIGKDIRNLIKKFADLKTELCEVCLGVDVDVCHKCSK